MKRRRTRKWITFENDKAVPLVILYKRTEDPAILSELTELFRGYGRNRAYSYAGGRHSADELFQEAFFGLVNAIKRWNPEGGQPFTPFARVKMRGAIQDFTRREARTPLPTLDETLEEIEVEDPAEELVDALDHQRLLPLLRKLTPRLPANWQKIVRLRMLGKDYNTIAKTVGCPRGTVSSGLRRSKLALRQMFQEEGILSYA